MAKMVENNRGKIMNPDKIKTARRTLLYVVIGVAVLIISKGLVSIIVSFVTP